MDTQKTTSETYDFTKQSRAILEEIAIQRTRISIGIICFATLLNTIASIYLAFEGLDECFQGAEVDAVTIGWITIIVQSSLTIPIYIISKRIRKALQTEEVNKTEISQIIKINKTVWQIWSYLTLTTTVLVLLPVLLGSLFFIIEKL